MFNFKWFYTLLFLMPVLLFVNPAVAQTGQELYNGSNCMVCHTSAVGSPAPGASELYTEAWNTSIQRTGGIDGLYQSAINGTPVGMPPCTNNITEDECILIIDYMLEAAGVSTSPPPPPPIKLELRLFLEGTLK